MPTNIGDVINNLAIKAGINPDDETLKSLLSAPDLAKITVPDEFVTAIDRGLLNIDAAKNNHPDVKRKYFADAYDGMDKFLLQQVENETFDDSDLAEIKSEKSTNKKIELIVSKLKTAAKSAKPEDKTAINKQIADLHDQLRLAKEGVNTVKTEYEGKIKTIKKDAALMAYFSKYNTIYDTLPGSVKAASLRALIDQELQDKQAELTVDENGALALVGKDGSNVFGSDHRQLTVDSFFDKSFAPILKVSNTVAKPNGVTQTTTPVQTTTPTAVNAGGGKAVAMFNPDANLDALKAFEDAPKM